MQQQQGQQQPQAQAIPGQVPQQQQVAAAAAAAAAANATTQAQAIITSVPQGVAQQIVSMATTVRFSCLNVYIVPHICFFIAVCNGWISFTDVSMCFTMF